MSSIFPWGSPSTMSKRTTSPSSRSAQSCASTPDLSAANECNLRSSHFDLLRVVVRFATPLRDGIHDCVQRRAGTHRPRRLLRIRPVVPAHVDGLPLRRDELRGDLRLVLREL